MSAASGPARPIGRARREPTWVRLLLIALAVGYLGLFLLVPMGTVIAEAFRKGAVQYFATFADPVAQKATLLTILAVLVSVPLNTIFGVAAAWCVTKFRFPGRAFLVTLIDLPISVSPVISGLVFVLLFGLQGVFGPWLRAHDIKIIFAVPGILLATLFVTFPYVARELIPLMESQGTEDEEAALSLGANGWQTFWRVTLPNIRWALLYGVILTTARAVGEFGAVSVVSGHIRGLTNTIPLHIEILYNEYQFVAAFAMSSVLVLLALLTLVVKTVVTRSRSAQLVEMRDGDEEPPGNPE